MLARARVKEGKRLPNKFVEDGVLVVTAHVVE